MAEEKSNWFRDGFLLPLIVGSILAGVSIFFLNLLQKDYNLNYNIDGPLKIFDKQSIDGLQVNIDSTFTSDLVTYKVHLWNSGTKSIKDGLHVLCVFKTDFPRFRIFRTSHSTTPPPEFLRITEWGNDSVKAGFIYGMLEPGDEDTITFFTNYPAELSLTARGQDVSGTPSNVNPHHYEFIAIIIIVISISVSALVFMLIRIRKDQS